MFCLQTCKGLIKWISKYLRKKHWQLVGRLTLTLTLDIEIVRNAQVFLMKRHSVKGDCWKAKQWWDKYFWTAKNILLCLTLIKFYLKLFCSCCCRLYGDTASKEVLERQYNDGINILNCQKYFIVVNAELIFLNCCCCC